MSERVEFLVRVALIGAGATLFMDAWAAALRRLGVRSLDFALLGRWIGHLPEGRWVHEGIANAARVPGERWIGWCAHYLIGIGFSALLLSVVGLRWARSPTLLPALAVGVVTVVAPLLILQPAFGAGIASSKTAAPLFNSLKSLATHTVYGVGLYLAARATASALPVEG